MLEYSGCHNQKIQTFNKKEYLKPSIFSFYYIEHFAW